MHCPSSKNVNSNSENHKTKAHLPHNRHFYVLGIYLITNDPICPVLETMRLLAGLILYEGHVSISRPVYGIFVSLPTLLNEVNPTLLI